MRRDATIRLTSKDKKAAKQATLDSRQGMLRDDGIVVHTNTAESFFALLKRGHYCIFHKLSKKHLHRYCTEFGFRWDGRKLSDGERMVAAINGVEGKRLMYRKPIDGLVG
jgi:hypothetical protein